MSFKKDQLDELIDILVPVGYVPLVQRQQISDWFDGLFTELTVTHTCPDFMRQSAITDIETAVRVNLTRHLADLLITKSPITKRTTDYDGVIFTAKVRIAKES